MPELPEVEQVAQKLDAMVKELRIKQAWLLRDRLAPDTTPAEFSSKLTGARITIVHRRGKFVIFDLDNGNSLVTHLRMSGRFMLLGPDQPEAKFTHAVFELDGDRRLIFQDQRHFGFMKVVATDRLSEEPAIVKLAPEPFSNAFNVDYLYRTLRSSGKSLKEFLLDQSRVCGLGNIYACEAMFLARISPLRRAKNLSRSRAARLHESIRTVLSEAMKSLERVVPDPVVVGEGIYGSGSLTNWMVYDREGEPCLDCGRPIRRIKQGGRSTYYCPTCQR